MTSEKEKDSLGNRDCNNLEIEASMPNFTNLTSVSFTTRYLSEEIRNIYKVMELRLKIMVERFEKFQARQLKLQEEFFEKFLQSGKVKKSKDNRDKDDIEDLDPK